MGDVSVGVMGNQPGSEEAAAPAAALPANQTKGPPPKSRNDLQKACDSDIERLRQQGIEVQNFEEGLKMDDPRKYYDFKEVLGAGHFGKVYSVVKKDTNEPFACKVINTKHKNMNPKMLQNEMGVLMTITHPYLIRITDSYKHRTDLYIIMPLVP